MLLKLQLIIWFKLYQSLYKSSILFLDWLYPPSMQQRCSCFLPCKLATLIEGDPKAPFSIATTPFPGLLHFTLDHYFIMLSVKQGSIKYYFFLSLWYDSTWDWTPISQTIGEHSTHYANGCQTLLFSLLPGKTYSSYVLFQLFIFFVDVTRSWVSRMVPSVVWTSDLF